MTRFISFKILPAMLATIAAILCVPAYAQVPETEIQKLTASDAAAHDHFGYSISIDGNTALISAPAAKAAYVFDLDGTGWIESQKLITSNSPGANFSNIVTSVAIDGDVAILGTSWDADNGYASGAALIYTFDGTVWRETQKLTASDGKINDHFGLSVAIDGDRAVIAGYNHVAEALDSYPGLGFAYVFTLNGTTWVESQKLTASDEEPYSEEWFGDSVAIDGNTVIIGAFGDDENGLDWSGSAYVFAFDGTGWIETQKLIASDSAADAWFGRSVAIDGNTAIIGAAGDDENGAAYIFTYDGTVWRETQKLTASDGYERDRFGRSVAIDGDTAVIGAPRESDSGTIDNGAAYVFTRSGGGWSEQTKLLASDKATVGLDDFGSSVALDGATAVIGAWHMNDGDLYHSGSAYVYRLDGPPSTTVRVEAEDMRLDTYKVESLRFASSGGLINLKGSVSNGSATTAFPGGSGRYNVIVVYHDENDGLAQLTVSIAGASIDSWILDQSVRNGQQPIERNRFARQIATNLTINTGDEIRIDGLQGNWDRANVDYIDFEVVEVQSTDKVRVEAEAMDLETYRVEMLDFASNGALINLKGPGLNGSATTAFPGSSGKYDVVVAYHDENDGLAQLTVTIAGVSIDSWVLDQAIPDGAQPQDYNRIVRKIATNLSVNNGDEIRIDGLQGNWDHANVDYIDFVIKEPPQSTVQIEAEDMRMYTYRVETLDFASDGALINLKGPGLNGSVSAAFPGNSGKYDITVVYHDENDGVAQLFVTIAGVAVDSWLLDFRSTEAQAKPANRRVREIATGYTVNNGDEIRIDGLQGNWDHANVDYIKFVAVP